MENTFKISPRVLAHLGEDLIKNESIALLELVKNSYDACASHCNVDFIFNNDQLLEIIIEDDGIGMNLDIIEKVWLVIGTDNKKDTLKKRQCGRVPLGEKGIGRLSVHKLGKKIRLITRQSNSKEVEIYIDWNKLINSKEIDDFKIIIEERNQPVHFAKKTGTLIKISDLNTIWDTRQLREVYRALNSLNSPFENTSDDFNVAVKSNTKVFEGLPDFSDIINAALYFAKCTIIDDKITKIEYEFKPWSNLTRMEKGRKKTTKDYDKFQLELSKGNGRNIENFSIKDYKIGPIEFEIAIFDFDTQIFNYLSASTEKKSVKDYLKENSGIRVFRDGVRVYDYGEKENDWLGIDLKRVHRVGGNISNHIVIGAVNLKDRSLSEDLKEKTNREGFVENKAYEKFSDAVNFALDLIVNERNEDKEKLTLLYKKHKAIEPVLSDLNEVVELINTKVDPPLKDEILKYLYRINDQYKEVKQVLIRSANAGLNLSIVIHEIEKLTAGLVGSINHNEFEKAINITLQLEKIIHSYSIMIKSSSIKKDALSEIVKLSIDNYEFRFSDHKIQTITNSSDLKAYYAISEAVSVLANLLDNSIFWLSYSRTENRAISVYITDQIKNYNSIIISDNGPGFKMPPEIAVKPFMTGKPNAIGSGLGLHIADEMMKAMKGQLLFLDENDINLPKKTMAHNATKAIIALCFPKEK